MGSHRRARLSPTEVAASVALTEAQLAGSVVNSRPFAKGGSVRFRVELVVEAWRVEALLATLAEPEPGV